MTTPGPSRTASSPGPSPLPPTAGTERILRLHCRTAFAGWSLWEGVLLATAGVLMGAAASARPLEPPVTGEVWFAGGGPGWAYVVSVILAVSLGLTLWGGGATGRSGVPDPRRGLRAMPVGRRTDELLRAAAGLAWVWGASACLLGLGTLGHRAATGELPALSPGVWAALVLSPGVLYLSMVLVGRGRRAWEAAPGWVFVLLLVLTPQGALPPTPENGVLAAVLHGAHGVVPALTGASPGAVVLWTVLVGAFVVWRAGWSPKREGDVAGGAGPVAMQTAPTTPDAVGTAVAPSVPGRTAPWARGTPPPLPGTAARLRAEIAALPGAMKHRDVLILVAFSAFLALVFHSEGWFWEIRELLATSPFMLLQSAVAVLGAMVVYSDDAHLGPGGFHRVGALPCSRRAWVTTRVAVRFGAVALAAAGVCLLWAVGATALGRTGGLPGPGQLLNALGLLALACLGVGAAVAASDRPTLSLVLVFSLPVVLMLLAIGLGAALATVAGEGLTVRDAVAVLRLEAVLAAEPTPARTGALIFWLLLGSGALWVSTGRREAGGG